MRTNRRPIALALLVSLAPATFAPVAFAQAPPPAADPTLAAAHARFAEGVEFFDKGQFENARASFLQAYALHKHPAVLINLAESSLKSGHTLDAAHYFRQYLHDSPSLTPAQRADAEKGLADARTKLGRIDVSAAAGVAVTIDGEVASTDGGTIWDVEPGTHTVKGGTDTTTVTVAAGQTVSAKLGAGGSATPAAGPGAPGMTPPAPGTGPAPPAPAPAPEGPSGPGIFSRPASLTPVFIGVGVGLAGFVTAIIFGVSKGSAQTSYDNQQAAIVKAAATPSNPNASGACVNPGSASLAQGCNALISDGNDVSTDATAANVGIAIGVVGVAFAAGWYLFAPKAQSGENKPAAALHFTPMVGRRTNGMSLGWEF